MYGLSYHGLACRQAFGRVGNWGEGKAPLPFPFLAIFSPKKNREPHFFPQKEPRACSQAITGRIARVQFNSTLERKVKTGALKDIFLVCKWINNTIKTNSVPYHVHHRKNLSFLSSFGLRAVFVKGSKIAVFVSIVTSKRAR